MRTVAILLLPLLIGTGLAQDQEAAWERLLRAVERAYLRAGDPWDVRARAAALGYDRDRIFAFVRDETAFEPYEGILRGSGGTLFARGGNSLDRALLLRGLLEACGEEVRIVSATLSPGASSALRGAFLKQEPFSRLAERERRGAALAEELGADPAALESFVREQGRQEAAWADEILDASRDEAARLHEMVRGKLPERPLEIPAEHYWVQVRDKEWTDLDPAAVALDRKSPHVLVDRDLDALRSTVTFKLLLDRDVRDKKERIPLLDVPLALEAVAWKPIHLNILPSPEHFPGAKEFAAMEEGDRIEALRKAAVFQAGLLVDCRPYGSAPFDLDGNTYEVSRDGRIGAAKNLGGAIGGLFQRGLGGGGGEEKPQSRLDKVIFEIVVSRPGTPERVHRRILYRGGSDATLMIGGAVLIDTCVPPDGEMERRTLRFLWRNQETIRSVLKGKTEGLPVRARCRFSSLLLTYVDLRRRIVAGILREGEGGLAYFRDRPGIVLEMKQLCWQGESARLRHWVDIVENRVAFASAAGSTAPAAAMRLGVADTALESLLMMRADPGDSSACAWTILRRERMLGGEAWQDEEDGNLRAAWGVGAWWRIDPAAGSCVGRVPSGEGQGMVEYAWEVAGKICDLSVFFSFYAAGGHGGQTASDADKIVGDICSIVSGTGPRRVVENKIGELQQDMWKAATNALAGMGG